MSAHDGVARGDGVAAGEHEVFDGDAGEACSATKGDEAQEFLDRGGDQGRVGDQAVPEGAVGQQQVDEVAGLVGGGLVAGEQQGDAEVDEFRLGEPVVDVAGGDQLGEQVVLGAGAVVRRSGRRGRP